MTRNDWCISAVLGTVLAGLGYAVWRTVSGGEENAVHGPLAIGGCCVLSMFAYIVRAFCRHPHDSPLAARPIRRGIWFAFLGGLAYGTCVAIGVSLAYWYAARPTWDYTTIKYSLIAQITTIVVCGAVMIPVGFLAGVIYSLYSWKRA